MNYENEYDARKSDTESESDTADDITDQDEVMSTAESDTSAKRLTRAQHIRAMKLSDPGYHSVVRGNRRVELYSTRCNPGAYIRDPRIGSLTRDRVGTLAERMYFKVRMTSIGDGVEPVTLFYDSPDSYEKHMRTRLPNDIKQSWRLNRASS